MSLVSVGDRTLRRYRRGIHPSWNTPTLPVEYELFDEASRQGAGKCPGRSHFLRSFRTAACPSDQRRFNRKEAQNATSAVVAARLNDDLRRRRPVDDRVVSGRLPNRAVVKAHCHDARQPGVELESEAVVECPCVPRTNCDVFNVVRRRSGHVERTAVFARLDLRTGSEISARLVGVRLEDLANGSASSIKNFTIVAFFADTF